MFAWGLVFVLLGAVFVVLFTAPVPLAPAAPAESVVALVEVFVVFAVLAVFPAFDVPLVVVPVEPVEALAVVSVAAEPVFSSAALLVVLALVELFAGFVVVLLAAFGNIRTSSTSDLCLDLSKRVLDALLYT